MDTRAPAAAGVVVALLRRAIDDVASKVAERPIRVGASPSVDGLLRGRLDELRLSLDGVATSGLAVDRVQVVARGVQVVPGLAPRVRADDVGVTGTVTEASANRWLRTDVGPLRIHLRPDGVAVRTSIGGVTVNEVGAELAVEGTWLRLRPVRTAVLGMSAPLASVMRGYLPLPPLPAGARIVDVGHGEGVVAVTLGLGAIDEALDLDLPARLRGRFRLDPIGRSGRSVDTDVVGR